MLKNVYLFVLILVITLFQCSNETFENISNIQTIDNNENSDENDNIPPVFEGILSAIPQSNSSVLVSWNPAYDNQTDSGSIVYKIYISQTSQNHNYDLYNYVTFPGDTTALITGLSSEIEYFIVVRAEDESGNIDTNAIEISITLPAVFIDSTNPVFNGVNSISLNSNNEIILSWNAASDDISLPEALTYSIYISETAGNQDFLSPDFFVSGTMQYTLSGLPDGKNYYIVVRAKDAAGNEETNSFELSIFLPDKTPPVFNGITNLAQISNTEVFLEWSFATDNITASNNIVYEVFVAEAGFPFDFSITSAPGGTNINNYTVTGLTYGVEYFFIVTAKDAENNINLNTAAISHIMTDIIAPVFNGIQSVTTILNYDDALSLSWNSASDNATTPSEIEYDIYINNCSLNLCLPNILSLSDFNPPDTVTFSMVPYTISGLQAGTTYNFLVKARDAAGNTDDNMNIFEITTLDYTPPVFSGITNASLTVGNDIFVEWPPAVDNVTDSLNIVYHIIVTDSLEEQSFTETITGITNHTLTDLAEGKEYLITVRAEDQSGNIDQNIIQQSVIMPDTTSPVFSGIASALTADYDKITLSWNAASDNVTPDSGIKYEIFHSEISGVFNFLSPSHITTEDILTFTVPMLNPSTTYYFVVRAKDAAGNIDQNTIETSATTNSVPNPVFYGLKTANSIDSDKIFITWDLAADDTTAPQDIKYQIYISTTSGGYDLAFPDFEVYNANSYMMTGLNSNTQYFIYIRAVDLDENVDFNDIELTVTTTSTADTTAPLFQGLTNVLYYDANNIHLNWQAAVDDVTPQEFITYKIYLSDSSGVFDFNNAYAISSMGETSLILTLPLSDNPYYLIVRAEDLAGNIDNNLIEKNNMAVINTNIAVDGIQNLPGSEIFVDVLGPSAFTFTTLTGANTSEIVTGSYAVTCAHVSGYIFSGNTFDAIIQPGSIYNVLCDYTTSFIYDGFETLDTSWINLGHIHNVSVDNTCGQDGTANCLSLYVESTRKSGIQKNLDNIAASYVSFYMKSEIYGADSIFEIGYNGLPAFNIECFAMWGPEDLYLNNVYTGYACDSDVFHLIEFENIDYINHTFDLYFDSIHIGNFSFMNNMNKFNYVKLLSDSMAGTVYFDELRIETP
ncbi:MAG: fibronectin type III domain-containing protein [Spirochaetia bacterium]|nr:fibronectin type III domain-containing protein [Spirochaetia bacterium]